PVAVNQHGEIGESDREWRWPLRQRTQLHLTADRPSTHQRAAARIGDAVIDRARGFHLSRCKTLVVVTGGALDRRGIEGAGVGPADYAVFQAIQLVALL